MKPSELNAIIQGDADEATRDKARDDKAVIINRVGEKIGRIRGKLTGQPFVEFREHLYSIPEDDREAAVDSKLSELGL